jgi:hypothetical protein
MSKVFPKPYLVAMNGAPTVKDQKESAGGNVGLGDGCSSIGSPSGFHAFMPPSMLCTLVKPAQARMLAARPARRPTLQ